MLDCNTLPGRRRLICRGYDVQGRKIPDSVRRQWLTHWGYPLESVERHLVDFPGKNIEVAPPHLPFSSVGEQKGRNAIRQSATTKGLPGTELKRMLQWVEKLKPKSATCSCDNLAAEMDNNGVEWCRRKRDDYIVPKMLENRQALSDAFKESRGWRGVLGLAAGLLPDTVVSRMAANFVDKACLLAEQNQESVRKVTEKRKGKSFTTAFRVTGSPRFISAAQLQEDIKLLIGKVPPDTVAIAGVARSGLYVATMMSMYLHLPLLTIRQSAGDVQNTGNGWRLGGQNQDTLPREKVLVVDDTVMTGNSLRAIEPLLKAQFTNYKTAAVYVNPLAIKKPDIFVAELPWPHLLEWNLFNSVLSPNMATDFDGILCRDCQPQQDDDGHRYREFIENAVPLYLSRKVPIPLIVTARLEKYRALTEAWLLRHGVQYRQLVMHPALTLQERNRDDIAAFKARHLQEWAQHHRASPPPIGFIESDDGQANRIAQFTGVMVICPSTGNVY